MVRQASLVLFRYGVVRRGMDRLVKAGMVRCALVRTGEVRHVRARIG